MKHQLPRQSLFLAEKPPGATPYLAWVKGQGYCRDTGMRWIRKGLVITFKFPDKAKGMLWIQLSEAERFLAVLKGEQPPNLPPPPTPHSAPTAALEWVGNASTILSSPSLAGITAAPTFDPPLQTTEWEREWANLWGIFRREFHPELYPPQPSQPTNEKDPTTKPTT
jgi:hypothetical protein